MSTGHILLLGAIAGGTIFLGLPMARVQAMGTASRAGLSALATGILLFLLWDVLSGAVSPIEHSLEQRDWGPFAGYAALGLGGFVLGLMSLVYYAEWMNNNGTIRQAENGQWRQEPDYVKALELYHRLTGEFAKGETRYYDQAQQQIKSITEPAISVGVSNIFLPDSELQFGLSARNVSRVDFALYRVDLARDVRFAANADAYIASFIGFVPASRPKLLVAVMVDRPQGAIYGGSVAAPAFQKIVGWAVPYLGIQPR